MKKYAIVIAMVSAMLAGHWDVFAQRPVGDTIIGTEPTYMYYVYDWWRCANHDPEAPLWFTHTHDPLFNTMYFDPRTFNELMQYYNGPRNIRPSPTSPDQGIQSNNQPFQLFAGNNIRGVQMVTERPIKIVGIAACAYAQAPRDTTLWYFRDELLPDAVNTSHLFLNTRDTTMAGRLTDSLILYKTTSGDPMYITGGPWRVEGPHRYLPLPPWLNYGVLVGIDRGTLVVDSAPIVPLYEVMFSKPEVVTDSFIVAGTSNNNDGSYETQYLPGNDNFSEIMWLWNHPPTRYWTIMYLPSYVPQNGRRALDFPFDQNVLWYKYRGASWKRYTLLWIGDSIDRITFAIFPIIDPDFDTVLCDVVRDVRMADSTDTTLTLMWNGGNNVEWEVQYMEVNGWDVWTATTTVPMVTLTGLRERTNYMVRVRGKCAWDTEYGEWSGWLDVYTGAHRDDPPQSVSNLERFTQMMPNPARGLVTVLSSYRLSRVVVYDLQGHAVLEQEDDGLATTIDVSGLAKGVYVVAIHTPAGIATKRLVVEGN